MNFHRVNDRWGYPTKVAPVNFEFSDELRVHLYLGSLFVSVDVIAVSTDMEDFLIFTEDQREFRLAYHEIRRTYGDVRVRNMFTRFEYGELRDLDVNFEFWFGNPDAPTLRAATALEPVNSLERLISGRCWQWDGDSDQPIQFNDDGSVGLSQFQTAGLELHWEVVDQRKILIEGRRGQKTYLFAILVIDNTTERYWCFNFLEDRILAASNRL